MEPFTPLGLKGPRLLGNHAEYSCLDDALHDALLTRT